MSKTEVHSVAESFLETASSVQSKLQKKGFMLPVKHNDGIRYKHLFVDKNKQGCYEVKNLHNQKIKYYNNISSPKIALALAIMLGNNVSIDIDKITAIDDEYHHWWYELHVFAYHKRKAIEHKDQIKKNILDARINQYTPYLEKAKLKANTVLTMAERNLFNTK